MLLVAEPIPAKTGCVAQHRCNLMQPCRWSTAKKLTQKRIRCSNVLQMCKAPRRLRLSRCLAHDRRQGTWVSTDMHGPMHHRTLELERLPKLVFHPHPEWQAILLRSQGGSGAARFAFAWSRGPIGCRSKSILFRTVSRVWPMVGKEHRPELPELRTWTGASEEPSCQRWQGAVPASERRTACVWV
jgi:hypothetical protein